MTLRMLSTLVSTVEKLLLLTGENLFPDDCIQYACMELLWNLKCFHYTSLNVYISLSYECVATQDLYQLDDV